MIHLFDVFLKWKPEWNVSYPILVQTSDETEASSYSSRFFFRPKSLRVVLTTRPNEHYTLQRLFYPLRGQHKFAMVSRAWRKILYNILFFEYAPTSFDADRRYSAIELVTQVLASGRTTFCPHRRPYNLYTRVTEINEEIAVVNAPTTKVAHNGSCRQGWLSPG